jgi:hypothetical protein
VQPAELPVPAAEQGDALTAWRRRLYAVAGVALVLALGFETVPLPVKAQTVPLTGVLAVLLLPFVALTSGMPRLTPLFKIVAAFCLFVAVQ